MIIECPKCGTKNRLPEAPKPGSRYRCSKCTETLAGAQSQRPHIERRATYKDAKQRARRRGAARVGGILVLFLTFALMAPQVGSTIADKISVNAKESLDIVMTPSDDLKDTAAPVALETLGEEEQELAGLMENTFKKADGEGLAAPQVGIPKRIVVVRLEASPTEKQVIAMVNPEIVEEHGKVVKPEGCLSIGRREWDIEVARSERIVVRYWTLDGEEVVEEQEGWDARIIQHEIDHLNGILITDYDKGLSADPRFITAIAVVFVVILVELRFTSR